MTWNGQEFEISIAQLQISRFLRPGTESKELPHRISTFSSKLYVVGIGKSAVTLNMIAMTM